MKRFKLARYILFLCCIVQSVQLIIAGCSHTKPYYHQDIPPEAKKERAAGGLLRYRLLLLGDGGAPRVREPVLETLENWAGKAATRTSIVFLGDNMYPEGLTERKRHEVVPRLGPQLDAIKSSGAHGLFIPGNHDWAGGKAEGLKAVLAQEMFINEALGGEARFLPPGGTPGPVSLDLPEVDPVVRLIVLDTQWWLHEHEKPVKAEEKVVDELIALLDTDLPVIVAGHHPLETYGSHGGFFDWKAHLFPARVLKRWLWVPVPIVGSVYPYARSHLYKSDQDMSGTRNRHMVAQLKRAFAARNSTARRTPLLVYVSGHEHSLQVLKGDVTDYLLVSGAAASRKVTEVMSGERTVFAHEHTGFMAIDFLHNGKVLLRVVEPDTPEVLFQHHLF